MHVLGEYKKKVIKYPRVSILRENIVFKDFYVMIKT